MVLEYDGKGGVEHDGRIRMKLRPLCALAPAATLAAALLTMPAASAQALPAARAGASVNLVSGADPFYIVDDDGQGYQIAGTGSNAPVLTIASGNRYSWVLQAGVNGTDWYWLENGDGNCLDATTIGSNVIYGESCVAGVKAQQFRPALDSDGLEVIENRLYSKYLTATSIESGALVYLAGDAPSPDNIWALVPS
jgi:hypothetical protein